MKKKIIKKWLIILFYTLIIMTLTGLLTYVALNHETWRDEAQAWLIARDLSFIGIIKQMSFEGHIFIWHFLLKILYIIGFQYKYISLISIIIIVISTCIILKKSPFNIFTKISIIFSIPFLYDYSIMARPYCLIPLGIVLIAKNYKKRHENPIKYLLSIMILFSSHVIMFATVGVLLTLFYLEEIFEIKNKTKKRIIFIIISIVICISFIAVVCIQILQGINDMSLVNNYEIQNYFFLIVNVVVSIAFKNLEYRLIKLLVIILFIYFVIYLLYLIKRNLKCFFILFFSVLYQSLIYHFIYLISFQRVESLIFIFILVIWILKVEKSNYKIYKIIDNAVVIVIIILLLSSTIGRYNVIFNDIKNQISSSKMTANFIEKRIKKNSTFIIIDNPQATSVIAYLKKDKYAYYSLDRKKYFTYEVWDHDQGQYDASDLLRRINKEFQKKENLYLVCSSECEKYNELVYEKKIGYYYQSPFSNTESYVIYKINNSFFE